MPDVIVHNFSERKNSLFYYLSIFFLPWLTLGVQVYGASLYLSFIFILLDLKFWIKSFGIIMQVPKSHLRFSIQGGVAVLFLFVALGINAFLSPIGFSFLFKIIAIVIGIKYFISFDFNIKSQKILHLSFYICTILSVLQFVEANFFHSQYFMIRRYFELSDFFTFGLGMDQGYFYAEGHLIPGITRVSGTASEPGHFSALLTLIFPFIFYNQKKILQFCWMVCFFCSLSKISLLLFGVCVFVYFISLSVFSAAIISSAAYFFFSMLLNTVNDPKVLLAVNSSVFERFNGYLIFSNLPLLNKLIGSGYRGACEVLPASILKLSESGNSKSNLYSGAEVCTSGGYSLFGSILTDFGILGCGLLATCLATYFYKNRATRTQGKFEISLLPIGSLFLILISSLQALHYTTFFPPVLFLLSFIIAKK